MAAQPAHHYRTAERLLKHAMDTYENDEGGYDDDGPVDVAELDIRAAIHESSRADAALFVAMAQVHATLATVTWEA